jgi:hypothetical protein
VEGCGIRETNRIFEVSFYDRRGGSFFYTDIYTFFSYTFKFVVPERKYGGEFSGKKVAAAV